MIKGIRGCNEPEKKNNPIVQIEGLPNIKLRRTRVRVVFVFQN